MRNITPGTILKTAAALDKKHNLIEVDIILRKMLEQAEDEGKTSMYTSVKPTEVDAITAELISKVFSVARVSTSPTSSPKIYNHAIPA